MKAIPMCLFTEWAKFPSFRLPHTTRIGVRFCVCFPPICFSACPRAHTSLGCSWNQKTGRGRKERDFESMDVGGERESLSPWTGSLRSGSGTLACAYKTRDPPVFLIDVCMRVCM